MWNRPTLPLFAVLVLAGCGDEPEPPSVAETTAEVGAPAATPGEMQNPPTTEPEETDGPAADAPTESDEDEEPPTALADARARCERGWAAFGEEDLYTAARELREGIALLRPMARESRAARRSLGACLYNVGRVAEARDGRDAARSDYAASLFYRANDVVRRRWVSIAPEGSTPPSTAPASLWRYVERAEQEECRDGRIDFSDDPLSAGAGYSVSCGARLQDVTIDGDRGAALVFRWSGYEPDIGRVGVAAATSLVVLEGGSWVERRGSIFEGDGVGTMDELIGEVSLRDVVLGGAPEILVEYEASWTYIGSSGDRGGTASGVLVCGDPPGDESFGCVDLSSYYSDSGDTGEPDVEPESRVLHPDGRVVIERRTWDDEEDAEGEPEREETTIAELFANAR